MAEHDGGMLFGDPPSPYDTLETWESYLSSIKELPENTIGLTAAIKRAEKKIERIKANPHHFSQVPVAAE